MVKRLILLIIILSGVFACTVSMPVETEPLKEAPVSTNIYRTGHDLNIEVAIPDEDWDFTSHLSDDGLVYSLVVRKISRKLGGVETIRPITDISRSQYPSGFKVVFTLANRHKLNTYKNDLGLHIRLSAVEPDLEMLSMKSFGSWADPETAASSFQGSETKGGVTSIKFDKPPVYRFGESGGRFFIDIFGVSILPGTIKQKGLLATNMMDGKTRLIFKNRQEICPDGSRLILGRTCKGYTGLHGFTRDKNEQTESFLFNLPGRPEMKVMNMKGLTAFGFKDTKLFSPLFARYEDGDVYKVEAREKDGLLWLIFIYENDLKYRKYYSGDKFFVVFYRG